MGGGANCFKIEGREGVKNEQIVIVELANLGCNKLNVIDEVW